MVNRANKSWITDNRISRRRKKTFAQAVIEGNNKIDNGSTGSEDLEMLISLLRVFLSVKIKRVLRKEKYRFV